jgi:hypothetical protein
MNATFATEKFIALTPTMSPCGPLRQILQRKRMSAFTVTAEVTGARSIRRFLTHDVTSPPSNTALRKDYSITSSERANNLGIQPIVNR